MKNRWIGIFGSVLVVVGVLTVVIYFLTRPIDTDENCTEYTIGTLAEVYGEPGSDYFAAVKYTVDEKEYSLVLALGEKEPDEDDEWMVYYDPANPEHAIIEKDPADHTALFIGFAVVAVGGYLVIFFGLPKKAEKENVK